MTPPFFGSKIMNLLVFFDFEPKKVFPGPDSMGFVWGGVGRALIQFMHFSAIFAMFVDLGDPVVPTLRGASGGCCDSICLLGYGRTFFCSL